jgi:hypothetical protein
MALRYHRIEAPEGSRELDYERSRIVPSQPADETPGHGHLHHLGTLSADGTFDPGDGIPSFDNPTNEIANFNNLYPSPEFSPAIDVATPRMTAPPTATDQAAAAATEASGTGAGTSGTQRTSQALASPSGLVIIANYDTSITSLPTAQFNNVTGAITAAIDFYEAAFSNPITLTIGFSVGNLGSGILGQSSLQAAELSYDTLRSHLEGPVTAAGGSPLPAYNPSGSTSDPFGPFAVWSASFGEMTALGFNVGNSADGSVTLSSTASFTYDPDNRAVGGKYDAIGTLEHEISEVMGRFTDYPATDGSYAPLDLFRYTSAGTIAANGGAAYFSINGGTTALAEFNNNSKYGGDAGDWSSHAGDVSPVVNDSYDAFSISGVENAVSPVDLTAMQMLGYTLAAACYAAGTGILTERGEVRVEDLAIGDRVVTRFTGIVPIKWIGHRRIDCDSHADPHLVWPVRIVTAAFGPGRPCRDLLLSPDHAVAVGDVLVPIRLLVNGASIRQETGVSEVHYFHIELDRHDLLLAHGLAAESYLDTGNRGMFANADTAAAPDALSDAAAGQPMREAMSCLPLCGAPAAVEPLWRGLAERSEAIGLALPEIATTDDPAVCIVAGKRRFTPTIRDRGHYTFVLPALPGGARLQSRWAVASALRPWLEDRRRLGVMVHRIALRCGSRLMEVALDDPTLVDGWWAAERDGTVIWRWTNGDAALPPTDDFTIVELSIGQTLPYPLAGPAEALDGARTARAALAA